jgi:topoisomerase-4 subunit A
VKFGDADSFREPIEIDAEEFIGVKSFKAKGKRLTTFAVESVIELEPKEVEEIVDDTDDEGDDSAEREVVEPDRSDDEVRDEITGQKRIF